jgi:hypothetical protein
LMEGWGGVGAQGVFCFPLKEGEAWGWGKGGVDDARKCKGGLVREAHERRQRRKRM